MLVSMPPKSDKTTIEIGIDELMTLPFVLSDFGSGKLLPCLVLFGPDNPTSQL